MHPSVFVTYAHDSAQHKDHVLLFCAFLRENGIDAWLDRYNEGSRQDWYSVIAEQIDRADYVVLVASPTYRRVAGTATGSTEHRGVRAEAAILKEKVYTDPERWRPRVLPVLFPGRTTADIPEFLGPNGSSHFPITELTIDGLGQLLYVLLGRRRHPAPPLGPLPELREYTPRVPWPTLGTSSARPRRFGRRWPGVAVLLVLALAAGILGWRWPRSPLVEVGGQVMAAAFPDVDLIAQARAATVVALDWTTVPFGVPADPARRRGSQASYLRSVELQDGSAVTAAIGVTLVRYPGSDRPSWVAVSYPLAVPLPRKADLAVVTGFARHAPAGWWMRLWVECDGGRLKEPVHPTEWNAFGTDNAPRVVDIDLSSCQGATQLRLVTLEGTSQPDPIPVVWARATLRRNVGTRSQTNPAGMAAAVTAPAGGQSVPACATVRGTGAPPVSNATYWLVERESSRDLFVKAVVLGTPRGDWTLVNIDIGGRPGNDSRKYQLMLVRIQDPALIPVFDDALHSPTQNLGLVDLPAGADTLARVDVTRLANSVC